MLLPKNIGSMVASFATFGKMEYWLLEFTDETFLFITKTLLAFHFHVVCALAIMASVEVLNATCISIISSGREMVVIELILNTTILTDAELSHWNIPFS